MFVMDSSPGKELSLHIFFGFGAEKCLAQDKRSDAAVGQGGSWIPNRQWHSSFSMADRGAAWAA
jgi:hypothetical protein